MAHKLFNQCINTINEQLVYLSAQKEYFNTWTQNGNPSSSFSRNTKLNLRNLFWIIVSHSIQSLPVALDAFYEQLDISPVGKSTLSTKRTLVKSTFFEAVNNALVSEFYRQPKVRKYKGYVLLACDGSRIALPDVEELGEIYGWYNTYQGEKLYPSGKMTIFQDPLNNITVVGQLVGKNVDERYTFEENYQRTNELVGGKSIMLVDRGYFSYLLMFKMEQEGQAFVMKARDLPWRKKFLDSGAKDAICEIEPSRATSIYKDPQWRSEQRKTLKVRLVRFDHPDGTVDVLVTNLMDRRHFKAADIIELYGLRWGAETAYSVYKNDIAIELFTSFRPDGVQQDFHGAVILYNLATIFAADYGKTYTRRKPNMNVAVGIVHNLCPYLASHTDIANSTRIKRDMEFMSHCMTDIRQHRSFPRVRRRRKTSGKFYRHTNFAYAL